MNTTLTDDTMIVTLRVSDIREIVRAAVAEALGAKGQHDLLDLKQVLARYGVGRNALLGAAKRGDIELSQGPRRKFLVRAAEVERWLTEKRYTPPDRTVPVDMEDWERQASQALEQAISQGRLRGMTPQEIVESRARRKVEQAERRRSRDQRSI